RDHRRAGVRGRRRRSPAAAGRSPVDADPPRPLVTADSPVLLFHLQPAHRRTAFVGAGLVFGDIALVSPLNALLHADRNAVTMRAPRVASNNVAARVVWG